MFAGTGGFVEGQTSQTGNVAGHFVEVVAVCVSGRGLHYIDICRTTCVECSCPYVGGQVFSQCN